MDEINNFENIQIPQAPKGNKSYLAAYVVLVLLIVIGSAAVYFNWFYKPSAPKAVKPETANQTVNNKSASAPPILPPVQQLDLEKRALLTTGVIKIIPITEAAPIAIDSLPEIPKKFVDQSTNDLTINQVKYEGGLEGYEISYVLKDIKIQDVERRFQIIALNNNFEMLKGSRAERFGFAEYESAEYKVRVLYVLNEDDTVAININIFKSQ